MESIDPATAAVPSAAATLSGTPAARPHYFTVWRWHFYTALFVVPFLFVLSLSGMAMMTLHGTTSMLGRSPDVVPAATLRPAADLVAAALAAVPGGTAEQIATPEAADRPAHLIVKSEGRSMVVAVDPYRAAVTGVHDKNGTLYALAERIHGTLLLGTAGDRLIEAAASLTILMIVTGLYLWLPGRGLGALVPRLTARGRGFWKELHGAAGTWVALVLLSFCLTGLAWAGIWGDRIVQAWSSFPLAKEAAQWSSVPPEGHEGHAHHATPDTHAAMGHGSATDVPWALAKVPMPQSDGQSGTPGIAGPVTLDTVLAWARDNGFQGQFRVSLPKDATGVYSVAAEAMSEDGVTPWADRTVHLDQYSGRVLADIGYADYSLAGKAMAWGIGLHMGMAGLWNLLLNFALLGLILLTCVSGVVMWWKRRPAGAGRLAAPPRPVNVPVWRGGLAVVVLLALAFPMGGAALLTVIALDALVMSRLPALRRMLG